MDSAIIKFVIKMQKIDEGTIQRELLKLSIPFDMNIIKEIHSFLDKFIGPLNYQDAQYHIPATCAIICQTIKIPTLNPNTYTSTGVKIENVMRHIGRLSKQKFLETVETQVKKSDSCNHSLIQKVGKIKIAFRVFKKYKTIFQNLSTQNGIPFSVNHDLLAFFWIIFLIAKHNLQALEDLNLSTKILVLIIQEVFSNYYGRQAKAKIRQYISQKDNFAELPKISQDQQRHIKDEIYNLVDSTLKTRDPSASPNCNNLIDNQILLCRLVDDLNSEYQKMFQALTEDRFIDEMTFLELTKNLTPQAFAFKPRQEPISKLISFDDDDDDDMEDQLKTEGKKPNFLEVGNSSQKSLAVSLFSSPTFNQIVEQQNEKYHTRARPSRSMSDFTPVSLGHTKSEWAKTFIKKFDQVYGSYIKNYFLEKQMNFDDFVKRAKQKIIKQTETLTNYIISNKQKQIVETLTMTLCLTAELLRRKPSLNIADEGVFNSILCISSYLYNSTIRFLSLQLQKYSQIYSAELVDCLNILYDISEYADLPPLINQILSQLEKQVLIKELWDSDTGYKLLLEGKKTSTESIFNRLERRIYERILQICTANKVDVSQVKKIEALVKQILQKKPQILIRSKLDQIIICSISACLNLNQVRYNLALSSIFQKYNSISLSFNSNKQCYPSSQEQGAPQSLIEFYNQVFIHKVQQIMSQQENPKYLYTPIRENHLRKLKVQSKLQTGISAFANRDMRSAFSGQGQSTYRNSIIEKMKEKSQRKNEDSQDQQSPTFGTGNRGMQFSLSRKFTFGPGTD